MTTEQTQAQPETRPSEVRSDALFDAAVDVLAAIEGGILYEDGGAWFIGMHGDADVTDLIGKELAKLREVLASNARLDRQEEAR
jgi:hypothetical protein